MLTFLYSAVHFITDKTEATEIINSMGDSIKDIEIKYIHNPHVVEIHNIFTNPARHNEKSNIIKLAEHGFPIYEQEFRKNLFNLRVICKNADEDFIAKTPGKECFINILEYLLPCTKKISTAGLETLLPGSQKITNLFHADSANVKRPRDESECWIERTSKRRQLTDHETRHQ